MVRLSDQVKHGDKVTIVSSTGQKLSGRAVMFNPKINAWILNTGGRYGSTAIADFSNIIKVEKQRERRRQ